MVIVSWFLHKDHRVVELSAINQTKTFIDQSNTYELNPKGFIRLQRNHHCKRDVIQISRSLNIFVKFSQCKVLKTCTYHVDLCSIPFSFTHIDTFLLVYPDLDILVSYPLLQFTESKVA